jgi:cobalamin biosynthesis protein CobT
MSSNIKPKATAKESPTEPFKRAVTGCMRAIARKPELEVSFAAERPGFVGGKARLPEPARKLNATEAAIVRGHADSIALKLACHDPSVHRKLVPGGPDRARRVRGGRAGPRRGDRGAAHVGRRQEPLRHDRRPLSPRQV